MLDKRYVLLVLVVITGLFILSKATIKPMAPNIAVKLYGHDGDIETLDTPRDKEIEPVEFKVDVLEFEHLSVLKHKNLGYIGRSENFFIDLECKFEVKVAGTYRFNVHSDDGFRLFINDIKLMEFVKDRSYAGNGVYCELNPGVHVMKLNYFQAKEKLGLKVNYKPKGYGRSYLVGEDSPYFRFIPYEEL